MSGEKLEKQCPMCWANSDITDKCVPKICSWWDEGAGQCAILSIAHSLRYLQKSTGDVT